MCESGSTEKSKLRGQEFTLTHVKLRASSGKQHEIAWCAAGRLVKEESIIGKISGLHGRLHDGAEEFTYSCYVSSPYLDERVRSERFAFDIKIARLDSMMAPQALAREGWSTIVTTFPLLLFSAPASPVRSIHLRLDGSVSHQSLLHFSSEHSAISTGCGCTRPEASIACTITRLPAEESNSNKLFDLTQYKPRAHSGAGMYAFPVHGF